MDLDQLLTEAAPPLARTPHTGAALRELVDTSRAAVRPRRRRRTALVGAVVVVAVGGTAAATGAVQHDWIPWTAPSQHSCQMQFSVGPADPDGEPNMWPAHIDRARQAAEVSAADAFLKNFDYSAVAQNRAIREWRAEQARIADINSGDDAPAETGDDLAILAVHWAVTKRLNEHLADLGYDMRPVKGSDFFLIVSTGTWQCDE